jgi:hypothetical protein
VFNHQHQKKKRTKKEKLYNYTSNKILWFLVFKNIFPNGNKKLKDSEMTDENPW